MNKAIIIHFSVIMAVVLVISFVFGLLGKFFDLPENTDEIIGILFFLGWIFWSTNNNSSKIEKLTHRIEKIEKNNH